MTRTLLQSWSAITSGLCHDWCDPSLLNEGCSNRDGPDYVGLDGRPLDSLVGVSPLGAAVRLTGTRLIATLVGGLIYDILRATCFQRYYR